MYHTNMSYNPDSHSLTVNDLPTLGRIRHSSDQSAIHRLSSVDITLEQHVPNPEVASQHSSLDDNDSYYSLKRIREQRRGYRDEDSSLSHRVKRFYKRQDELIDTYERVHNQDGSNGSDILQAEQHALEQTQRIATILTRLSLAVNIVCQT
jgi:hypothetical protein